jgi:hypothetical protein
MMDPDESPDTSTGELTEGYEYPVIKFMLDDGDVSDYLSAVGDADSITVRMGLVPPLAAAARALAALSKGSVSPPGAVHSSQELEFVRPISLGEPLELTARVEKKLDRQDLHMLTTGFQIVDRSRDIVMTGKITVACRSTEAKWSRTSQI